ncbi:MULTISPECIES: (d)CMP kinase [Microbacterium]|uniref:Cytidylate kinase n=1 Tax=Microbacterium barkeri TaxID=33917 RepID=A0A9W6H3M8_9MICO|nr:(d)CMP kinase [Microbacterium barkeri]MDI6943661.1 (d)CMP kinase [Microbacterium barkeri]MDR6875483.1 cytidylate kinase [Microbacterium barkeri]GLJ61668.1 cytidylate kinase [Microbacterium barkeri]
MTEPFFIGIDGPAGAGKSSVSKESARRLGYGYLDTGSVYRALAWHVLAAGASTDDADAVLAAFETFEPVVSLDPDVRTIRVGETDVTQAIRTPETSAAVSGVARVLPVREKVNALFRALVAESGLPGVVVEGRDITTVVAPDAPVRILLTAHPDVRAARRSAELGDPDTAAVAEAMRKRDASDSKVVDFLHAAPGVDVVDTTDLDFDQSVAAVLAVIDEKTGGRDGR